MDGCGLARTLRIQYSCIHGAIRGGRLCRRALSTTFGELNLAQSWPLSGRDSARQSVSRLRSLKSPGLGGVVKVPSDKGLDRYWNKETAKSCHWTTGPERGRQAKRSGEEKKKSFESVLLSGCWLASPFPICLLYTYGHPSFANFGSHPSYSTPSHCSFSPIPSGWVYPLCLSGVWTPSF